VRLAETHAPARDHHSWLEIDADTAVGQREVIIQGRYSRTLYVYAVSLVVPERLPETVRDRLEVQGEGLGRLLNEAKIETRREVLWYAREHAAELPDAVRRRSDGEFITRVYRIIARNRPVALITERFPCMLGSLPSRE
jgi:chorismate-pyruvate lyase